MSCVHYRLSMGLNDLYVNSIVRDTCSKNNFTRQYVNVDGEYKFHVCVRVYTN